MLFRESDYGIVAREFEAVVDEYIAAAVYQSQHQQTQAGAGQVVGATSGRVSPKNAGSGRSSPKPGGGSGRASPSNKQLAATAPSAASIAAATTAAAAALASSKAAPGPTN